MVELFKYFEFANLILIVVFGSVCKLIWENTFGKDKNVQKVPPREMSKEEKAEIDIQLADMRKEIRKDQRKGFIDFIYGLILYVGSLAWLFYFLLWSAEITSSWGSIFLLLVGIAPFAYLVSGSGKGTEQNYPDDGSDGGGM